MDSIIGTCPTCGSFVWAQIDGDPPIPVKGTCSCWSSEILTSKISNWEALGKVDRTIIKVIYEEKDNDSG